MTPRFLREEAARFRGMANDTDREATRERFLAMAADYDNRAQAAHAAEAPVPGAAGEAVSEPYSNEANSEPDEATPNETLKATRGAKIAAGLKETVLVQRRPVGRPRRE